MTPPTAPSIVGPVDGSGLVEARVFVHASRIVAFQRKLGPWLESEGLDIAPIAEGLDLATFDSSTFSAPHNANYGPRNAWALPDVSIDSVRDRMAACWIVDNWTDTGRAFAAGLLANPEGIRTKVLAREVGYEGNISSAFRHVAGRMRSCNMRPFWQGNHETKGDVDGQVLSVDVESDRYRLFLDALRSRHPDSFG